MKNQNKQSGDITPKNRNKIITYSIVIAAIYFACFALLSTHTFQEWALWPFFESMIGVFMGAGAIAIITGIILVVQSVIESDREKKQKVFDKKLALYSGIIDQMEGFYRLKDEEEAPLIDDQERMGLFFTQLKVALLARPKTFRSYSQLISDFADDEGVIKDEASRLLLEFVVDARNDLDVQEEMSPEDQKSFSESLEIAKKAADNIQKTGRGTYFVSDAPFQQYLDQFMTPEGRRDLGFTKAMIDKKPEKSAIETINAVHEHLKEHFEYRPGVNFDYTRTGGLACFALGQKRNAKFSYLRFEVWDFKPGDGFEPGKREAVVLYLLKSPKNEYQVPKIDGVFTASSTHGNEFFRVNLNTPEQFNSQVKALIEEAFEARNDGLVTQEKKSRKALIALFQNELNAFRGNGL